MRHDTRSRSPQAARSPMTFLSLFAGIGGFDLALTRLGMRCVGQVEIHPVCRSILARHFPEVARHDDVRTTIAWWHTLARPAVDLICAGWPCQDVSQAGRRAGLAGTRTGLFFELARVIGALSPRWMRATSESPNAAEESCLSAIVEPHAPSKYSLSPKAARGILRRAARRGRALPPPLQVALEHLAAQTPPDPTAKTTTIPSPPP